MWEFWIDVGGTFTDCIGRSPSGDLRTVKTLSSGTTPGRVDRREDRVVVDVLRCGDPMRFWVGYQARFTSDRGEEIARARVADSTGSDGHLIFDVLPDVVRPGMNYELVSGEEAPIVAIRRILELRLDEPLPPLILKLGTTRGTNALLERKGARTAFITTKGFADILLIGNQDRPRLFDLAILKPEPLFEQVVEIDERLAADGRVLRTPVESVVHEQLRRLRTTGVASLGVCLLHAYVDGAHELLVERLARDVGFTEISLSHRLAPLVKIVSRGDTTVMDAYLNPVLREYVGRLHSSLATPASPRRRTATLLMTSAGGLVSADRFVGKDSILSGPAGGVIGFSRVAERAGFAKSIGFDMGGTSTDVARYDGTFDREFETIKAGVRVVAPMLAIETVAAGGGSICGFDGVKLHVGPESAGAEPGPACYGRGGPLTVTDVNLFLGKVLPNRFPFPLDRNAVERRLVELCESIANSPLGRRYTPIELAAGFTAIANANMTRAIRRISVAKGYDPRDYALVTFGGAGAQHACAIAESLGIESVLIHPFAGILSAYGIGLADVRRQGERAILVVYGPETATNLETVFGELERLAIEEVRAEGVPTERIESPLRSLELRYHGTDATILVSDPDDGDWSTAFVEQHRTLYGYVHADRPVEVVNARIEVVGRMPEPAEAVSSLVPRRPEPSETTRTWFAGREQETAVHLRAQLHPGDELYGPCIVCEPTSTIVVEPGWWGRVLERGEIVLQERSLDPVHVSGDATTSTNTVDALPSDEAGPTPRLPDPVKLEIFNNLFASIAEQMGLVLKRTSFSTNVKERLDFSCAIFDPTGGLVVNAPHIPVHLGAMGETVKRILADNPDLAPGDVIVTNDPYRGGSHLPDVTVVTPVFGVSPSDVDGGPNSTRPDHATATPQPRTAPGSESVPAISSPSGSGAIGSSLLFLVASRAHHAEIGGIVPGSMPPFSRNLGEEGVLIRNFKLVDRGESREEALRALLQSGPYPSRNVYDNLADVAAQVAANNDGVRQLLELVARYSRETVQSYMGHIQSAATAKMRLALAAIDDGEYAFTDHLDDGSPIVVTITIAGASATVDFTGTGPVLASNLNANRAIVTAAVMYVFRCLIAEDIPLNGGVLEPLVIVLPECLLDPPEHDDPAECPAIVGGNVETSQRVVDVLLGALGIAAASQGTMNNLTFGNETFGYYETICGGSGATPSHDGADAVHTHMTNTRLTDPEVIERRYPVRVHEFAIRRGSGGAGRLRGGDGVVRRIEFLAPLSVSMLSERRGPYAPFGLAGGHSGALGRNELRRAGSETVEDLGGKFAISVEPGDELTIETPGGGGGPHPRVPPDRGDLKDSQ